MNLKVLTLIIFASLLFSINVNASPAFFVKEYNPLIKKQPVAMRKSSFVAVETLTSSEVFPNQFETKTTRDVKPLSLKADFWFAFFVIGSLASMWLIKSNKG
ncbi:MAG: hypothetical protein EOO07_10155 [Chitinophagaceae bacterium]|nr:MAG: hypothetical protein EOO07_10155 [Chitinophagaceae bacterium]